MKDSEFQSIIEKVRCKTFRIMANREPFDEGIRLMATRDVEDSHNPGRIIQLVSNSIITASNLRTTEHALKEVLCLLERFEMHELQEQFLFDGCRIFDPHLGEIPGYHQEPLLRQTPEAPLPVLPKKKSFFHRFTRRPI